MWDCVRQGGAPPHVSSTDDHTRHHSNGRAISLKIINMYPLQAGAPF